MDIVDQIKGAVEGHEEQIEQGIDQVGAMIDQATGEKFSAQIDQAEDFLKDQLS